MKKAYMYSAVGALFAITASSAFAQSSVTLYGIMDTAIRYQTNAGPDGKDVLGMTSGPVTTSRWGLKGQEDLGGGLSAVFQLENGFNVSNGKMSSPNTLFNRTAFVGLSSNRYGTLTFGNNQAPLLDTMGNVFDPMMVGNYWQDSWMWNGVGQFLYVDNSVKYNATFGGLNIDAMYGFGNQAGALGLGSMYAVQLTYVYGPASINAGFQQNDVASTTSGSPVNGAKFNLLNISGKYQLTPTVSLLAGWVHSQDQTGMTDANMQQAGAPTLPGRSPNRIDDTFYVGTHWQATNPLLITVAGYYGHTRNAERLDGTLGSGINYSATVLAEYSLSKRTEIYGTADFAHGNGAFAADYPGVTNRNTGAIDTVGRTNNVGVAIGLRNMF
ncbi:porin [Trinickia fusca]|uniref:Porin n=1 Tax=Trinickia fusca TaxID=2419777 RepID=A0A494XJ75_9BURK|nr:porin [Trinickia fusca]RKP48169.1 porin [Trinickia fusca]